MRDVRAAGSALVLLGFLVLCASSASGDACTPVVYAFRHAEDTNPPNPPPIFALTPTGTAHAGLYPAMIRDFAKHNNICPVVKVYAATTVGKENTPKDPCGSECASATNAFDTAKPLAWEIMSSDPITAIDNDELYEYLGNGNKAPTNPNYYDTDTAKALRAALVATANANGGSSSAIFWTSQGLHVLGGVIIRGNNSIVPDKNAPNDKRATPPRNAVYIFRADGTAPSIGGFKDTDPPSSLYVQCFNHVEASAGKFSSPQFTDPYYYCGYGSQANLGGAPGAPSTPDKTNPPGTPCKVGAQCGTISNADNAKIKGKICNTTSLVKQTAGADLFGACLDAEGSPQ